MVGVFASPRTSHMLRVAAPWLHLPLTSAQPACFPAFVISVISSACSCRTVVTLLLLFCALHHSQPALALLLSSDFQGPFSTSLPTPPSPSAPYSSEPPRIPPQHRSSVQFNSLSDAPSSSRLHSPLTSCCQPTDTPQPPGFVCSNAFLHDATRRSTAGTYTLLLTPCFPRPLHPRTTSRTTLPTSRSLLPPVQISPFCNNELRHNSARPT